MNEKISLISWNVNGIRAWYKKGCLDWVLKQSPDFFCIQETKAEQSQLPDELLEPKNYFLYMSHSEVRKGYSGVAIYTKHEANDVQYGLGVKELDQEGRLITLFYDGFVVITGYYPNGGGGPLRLEYKLKYYDAFLKYLEKLRKKGNEIIFCGDINTAHTAVDLARPKANEENTGFLPVERAWIDKVIKKGYVDTWRHMNPDVIDRYSYWDMKTRARDRNVGWRIDYFFVSEGLVSSIKKADIFDDVEGSDHCPIYLEMGFR